MERFRRWEWALILLAILFSLAIRLVHLERGWKRYHDLFFYEGRPLLVGMDAYYYLRLTKDLLEHRYHLKDELRPGLRPSPPPLLVVITALLKKITNVPLEWWAFFLPPLFASFLVFPLYLWGRLFQGPLTAFGASLLGGGTFYWYTRTSLGRFDTDALLPFFVFLIPYLFLRIAQKGLSKTRGLALLVLTILFVWWWPPAKIMIFPLLFLSYGATWPLVEGPKKRRRGLALLAAFLSLGLFFLPFHFFPPWVVPYLREGKELLFMLLGRPIGPIVVRISELRPPDLSFLSEALGPHIIFPLGGLGGLFFLAYKRARFFFVLLFPLLLALLSFWARRFFIYVVPFYAWGWAFLCSVSFSCSRKRLWALFFGVLFCFLVLLNAIPCLQKTMLPVVDRNFVSLVSTLKEKTPPRTLVWCWWDYGYLVQYYAERPTLADGGFQQPWRILVLSRPLGMKDEERARRWIKLFVQAGPELFKELVSHLGVRKTLELLEDTLSGKPTDLAPFLKKRKPTQGVVLFLPYRMFRTSNWARYSYWEGGRLPQATSRILYTPAPDFDVQRGILTLKTRDKLEKIPLKRAFLVDFRPFPKIRNRFEFPNPKGLVWFRPLQARYSFLFDQKTTQGLAVRFLFFDSARLAQTPSPFQLLFYKPLTGGVFKVCF